MKRPGLGWMLARFAACNQSGADRARRPLRAGGCSGNLPRIAAGRSRMLAVVEFRASSCFRAGGGALVTRAGSQAIAAACNNAPRIAHSGPGVAAMPFIRAAACGVRTGKQRPGKARSRARPVPANKTTSSARPGRPRPRALRRKPFAGGNALRMPKANAERLSV